jgi:hypothetical protein
LFVVPVVISSSADINDERAVELAHPPSEVVSKMIAVTAKSFPQFTLANFTDAIFSPHADQL